MWVPILDQKIILKIEKRKEKKNSCFLFCKDQNTAKIKRFVGKKIKSIKDLHWMKKHFHHQGLENYTHQQKKKKKGFLK